MKIKPLLLVIRKNGRIETRKYTTIKNVSYLPSIDKWPTVKGIGKLETTMINKKSNIKNHKIRYFQLVMEMKNLLDIKEIIGKLNHFIMC